MTSGAVMSPRDTARGPPGTRTQNGDGPGCVGRYTVAYSFSQTAATVANRIKIMKTIPTTVRLSRARVWAVVLPNEAPRRTRNLYPFDYIVDPGVILADIAKFEREIARERGLMFGAMRIGFAPGIRAFRTAMEKRAMQSAA